MANRSRLNFIPSGRQLPRTPPVVQVKQELDFSSEDLTSEEPLTCEEMTEWASGEQLDSKVNTAGTTIGCADCSDSLLRGMKGYELTTNDLDFIRMLKVDKRSKLLEEQLKEVHKELMSETAALELALASREKMCAHLGKFPSSSELAELLKLVLRVTSPAMEVSELDTRSLLARVTREDVDVALSEKRKAISQLEKMASRQRMKDTKERGRLEKQLASGQLLIQQLICDLSDLTSKLAQQDELKDGGGPTEEVQAAEGPVKDPEKVKRKIVAPKKSRPADQDKSSSKSKKTSLKTTTASTRQQMLADNTEPVQGPRGRQKPVGPSKGSASQVKHGRQAKNSIPAHQKAEAEPMLVLRRSKRIANRK
uniref:uncharacterized protein LOC131104462 n=1 Tax=Doryrhamphus excisus TaxID=161450 RepID=UPI0025ADE35C|nr:uncharacterized protein LOC131104462 [Doryrhamphus excisus]